VKEAEKEFWERDGIMDEELEQIMIDLGWPNSDGQYNSGFVMHALLIFIILRVV
jgi:hypothetical protein